MKIIYTIFVTLIFLLLITLSVGTASSKQTFTYTSPVGSRFTLRLNGNLIELRDDADNLLTWAQFNLVSHIFINGADNEDDTLTVDLNNGVPIPLGGLFYEGGTKGFDTLIFSGGSATQFSHLAENSNDGDIYISERHIRYTGLEPITSTITAANIVLNYGNTSEVLTIIDAGAGQGTVNSTVGELITFNIPTASLTINAGGGNDIINLNSFPAGHGALPLTINGDAGINTLNYNAGAGPRTLVMAGGSSGIISQAGYPNVTFNTLNIIGAGITGGFDYGDAPDPTYPTLTVNDGARHTRGSNIYLGNGVDSEADGQPNATSTGDDAAAGLLTTGVPNGDDDGVVFGSAITPGAVVGVNVTASNACTLSAWIDFNSDGDWGDAGEDIFPGGQILAAGVNALNFNVPAGAAPGNTFARFRATTDGAVNFTGAATNGEVEDYQVSIVAAPTSVPIPTMSEWGMILFSILLGAIALFCIQKKSTQIL